MVYSNKKGGLGHFLNEKLSETIFLNQYLNGK
jgi:hypothetical protein